MAFASVMSPATTTILSRCADIRCSLSVSAGDAGPIDSPNRREYSAQVVPMPIGLKGDRDLSFGEREILVLQRCDGIV